MANFVNSGNPSILYLRRDLEDLLDDMEAPRRMRREMDRLFAEATTPMSLWRDMDQLLEEFLCPLPLRRRIEHVFSRFLPVSSSYATPWRGVDAFTSGRGEYFAPVRGEVLSPMRSAERVWGRAPGFRMSEDFVPPVELIERDGEYLVRVELAGVREQDVEIRANDHVLTIRGERRERFDNDVRHMANYEYSERRYGTFSRTVTLPHGIDAAHIHAVFRDGVLELRIPQTETFRQRRIPIGREDQARVINEGNAGHPRPHVS